MEQNLEIPQEKVEEIREMCKRDRRVYKRYR